MRWIVFVLWLLLIPPALVLIALMFISLWKRLAVHIAGEFEPSYSALLSRGSVRTGLVATALGVCAGAIVGQSTFDTAVSNRSAAQTETAESQSFSVELKAVRTESVKSPAQPTSSDQVQDLSELNELKAKIREAEVAQRNFVAGLPHCSELNGTNFYFYPQNRALNLQDYRRSLENLVAQGAFNQETQRPWNKQDADARLAQVQKQATTDQANCRAFASLPSLRQKLKELQWRH